MFSKTLVRNAMLFIEPNLGRNDTQGYIGMPQFRFIGNSKVQLLHNAKDVPISCILFRAR